MVQEILEGGVFHALRTNHYCEVIAIADRDCKKAIEGISVISIESVMAIEYDYIIVCTIDAYQEDMCQKLFDLKIPQEKIVCVSDYVESVAEVRDSSLNSAFHHLMVEEKYRNISLKTNPEMFSWHRNYHNWIHDTDKIMKLLLLGYEMLNPVFHILDNNNNYLGTINRTSISAINEVLDHPYDNCTVRHVCEILKNEDIELYRASDISISVCEMYKRFCSGNGLTELPITENGKLVDSIKRNDFYAFFSQRNVKDSVLHISERFSRDYENIGLNRYAYNVNSQNGEDGIIEYIFEKIEIKSCFAVEFGGWDGIYLSNIRNFVLSNDINALFIEGDPGKVQEGRRNYKENYKVAFANEWVGVRKNKKLDLILEEHHVPKELDLLSIDIDGYDYWVWESLKKYRPRVVIIEFNPATTNEVVMINPDNESLLYGSSPLAMVELGKRKGYELAAVTNCNCIFVVSEEFEKLGIVDNSLEYLRRGKVRDFALPMVTFQGNLYNNVFGR